MNKINTKNITIELWTNLYYAKFIAIWRPEEDGGTTPKPGEDERPEDERNLPYYYVTSVTYKGRNEVVGGNPIAPSQHPMPISFLESQVRSISYMVANGFGLFQPPSLVQARNFISREVLGYRKVKEMQVEVFAPTELMSLKNYKKLILDNFTDAEMQSIKVMAISEHPNDTILKGVDNAVHIPNGYQTEQYITVTNIDNIYKIDDPYISFNTLPDDPYGKYPRAVLGDPTEIDSINETLDAIASSDAELELIKTYDKLTQEQMESDTTVNNIQRPLTRTEVQMETIKKLKAIKGNNNIGA